MAAKHTSNDLTASQRTEGDAAQAAYQPAAVTVTNSQASSVSEDLFIPSTNLTAVDLALRELLSTIVEATEVRNKPNVRPRLLQSHIAALQEDAEMVASFEIKDDILRTKVTQAVLQARKLRRQLERDIIDREIEIEADTRNAQPQVQLIQLDTNKSTGMKLAPLKPPTFNGDATQFSIYREFFEENVLNNDQLTDTAKWLRLTESLTGPPAELLSELPRTGQTLTVAWKLLLETFSADDKPIAVLYAKLQNLPPAKMETGSLKMTHSKLEGVLMTLEHLGHEVGENGYIRWLYMNKFPVEIAYQVQKKRNTPLAELRTAIGDLIRAREGADQQAGQFTFAPPVPIARKPTAVPRTTTTEPGAQKKATGTSVRVCAFCSADHWNDMCGTYSTIEARKQRLAGKCFICFRRVHEGGCVNPRRCFHCDSINHNRALCPTRFSDPATSKNAVVQAAIVGKENEAPARGYFLAFIAQAFSQYVQQPVEIRVIVDTGGGSTILRREIADQLRISTQKTTKTAYTGLGGAQLIRSQPLQGPIFLKSRNGTDIEIHAEAVEWTIPEIPTADIGEFRERNPQFCDVYIPPTGQGRPVDLLIGSDMMVELLLPEPIRKVDDNTFLMPTAFGSLIVGRSREQNSQVRHNLLFNAQTNPLYQMCNLDLVGLAGLHSTDIDEEEQAISNFYDTVRFIDGRYSISWPWRTYPPNLDTNFGLALGRLKTLHRKLKNSPQLLLDYHKIILRQLDAEVIEAVDGRQQSAEVTHYVPHHPVLQPEKEVRPVYDGSSRTNKAKKSLNDNILKGKNWLNDLVKTLLRFRQYKNACISDIAKAFHQIAINTADCDAVRFIWLRDPLQAPTDDNLQIYRFTRVAFGIVASPFILSATIQYHASKQEENEHLRILLQDMYADNLVTSTPETVDFKNFYDYSKEFFGSMSMNLTKWSTNNEDLQKHVPVADYTPDIVQSVLGLKWNTKDDTLRFKLPKPQLVKMYTRRTVAREMASYFDPMGWAVPILLLAKNFFRKLWAKTDRWDEALKEERKQEWIEIAEKLKQINYIQLPRRLNTFDGAQEFQLHAFVDASAVAYAVVVYLRVRRNQATRSSMVAVKSRLTPMKSTTIPKLELIAIILGCRFLSFVRTALQIAEMETFIRSDSKCALSWMRQEKILPTAIERYITEAKTYQIDNFRFVPSEKNYADVATRGAEMHTLEQMDWWTGPQWLYEEANWPAKEPVEIDQNVSLMFQAKLFMKKEPLKETEITGVANIEIWKFSDLKKLLLRTAYILQALIRLVKRNFLNLQATLDTPFALKLWIRWDQNRQYAVEAEETAGRSFLLRGISVFRDKDGIIRCQTRLKNSFLELETVQPVLLVQNSTLTTLIILQAHRQQMHAGTNHTLASLRQKYWLPHGRRQVYKVIINKCFVCRREGARTYPTPPPAPLPEFRVLRAQRPFQVVGVDIFGPFTVRQKSGSNLQKEKRWTLIFTCATIRAVHLEILSEMTTIEISYAFRRCFARRGVPNKIISDNAPQFHVLDNHFQNLWKTLAGTPAISNYFAENQIVWEFIPELAPWMGSIYERLIQSIKKAFEKTYADKTLTIKQFELAMIEIEAVVNSRPIAYIDRDPECPILTPNDFLSAKFPAIPIQQTPNETDDTFAKLWKSSQAYLDQFWDAWATQYLMILRERNDQLKRQRTNAKQSPVKGDIVIMQDLTKKRSTWQLAVVERMIPSKDKEIRAVQIRIPNGSRLIRPVITLAPLGIKTDLPAVRDEQLNKRRDAVVVWPIEDVRIRELEQMYSDVNNDDAETPPHTQSDEIGRTCNLADGQLPSTSKVL